MWQKILIGAAAVTMAFLLLSFVCIVSVTWTHRTDLSVRDILSDIINELRLALKAAFCQRKGKTNEQHNYL